MPAIWFAQRCDWRRCNGNLHIDGRYAKCLSCGRRTELRPWPKGLMAAGFAAFRAP